jgi:hypothetical protein
MGNALKSKTSLEIVYNCRQVYDIIIGIQFWES